MRSTRSRKQQTRLQFQPLSSSSPIRTGHSDAVRDRLANVRILGGKIGKQAATHQTAPSLPTPGATLPCAQNVRINGPSSPLSDVRSSPPIPPRFLDSISDPSSDEDEIVLPSSKRRRISNLETVKAMRNTSSALHQPETQGGQALVSTSSPLSTSHILHSTPTRRSRRNRAGDSTLSRTRESNVKTPEHTPNRRSTRQSNKGYSATETGFTSSTKRVVSVDIPTPEHSLSNIGSAESSGDDVMVTRPILRNRVVTHRKPKHDTFVVNDDKPIAVVSDTSSWSKKCQNRRKGPDVAEDFIAGDDEIEYLTSSDDSVARPSPSKHCRSSQKQTSQIQSRRHPQKRHKREQDELDEDLKDLQDSEPEATNMSRTRGGPVTTQRDMNKKHFELLKKRRAGERKIHVVDSDIEAELNSNYGGADLENIGRGTHTIEIDTDNEESVQLLEDEFDHIADDDDFIVDDQAPIGRLGRPSNSVPLQFTSFASAKPRELFPHIIEWMVKNKISPAFNRDDEVYKLSFTRIDDQVKAQAGSRLISAAWQATFRYAVLARPGIHITALEGHGDELIRTCDACNRTNHPATYGFSFSGQAYSNATLEPIDDSDSDDNENDDGDDDHISHDEQGHVLPSKNMHFYLGRFCAANAEMGHKLTHWKHHLNEQVLAYLDEQQVLSAEAIVSREKLNKKKREKEAENIVDAMQETGMITELWRSFQDDLEDARIGMEGHERKGGRGKNRIGSVQVRRSDGVVGEWNEGGRYRTIATPLESGSEGE